MCGQEYRSSPSVKAEIKLECASYCVPTDAFAKSARERGDPTIFSKNIVSCCFEKAMAMQGDKQACLENIQHRQLKVFTFNSLIVVVGRIVKEHG
jgi:hypothetical protein